MTRLSAIDALNRGCRQRGHGPGLGDQSDSKQNLTRQSNDPLKEILFYRKIIYDSVVISS